MAGLDPAISPGLARLRQLIGIDRRVNPGDDAEL
jgi:hypothetical protein